MTSTSPEPNSDFDLVQRWNRGDRAAGDEVIRRHFPALRRFFLTRVSDPEVRADLIQETLTALTQAAAGFEGRSSFKTFMFGIARNKLYSHLRRSYRPGGAFDPLTESIEDIVGRSPSSYAALHQDSQRLLSAMAELPVDDQVMLELRYWHELSGPELAELFEISHQSVRGRLLRARRKLARKLVLDEGTAETQLERRLRAVGNDV